ncbi:hypothetical protein ACFVXG_03905 [Kitasatospora sp. NPDC058162]|uniref:hypothetical protein n=1 Tax=Kitasatospora sp. NPDC058162 TaxID=3346362 RepID=UPI0036DD9093
MTVHWDTESLERTGSGPIWGGVWCEIEGEAFPEQGWSDFPVLFAAELLDAFAEVASAPRRRRRVRFYDGPFRVELASGENGAVILTAESRSAELPVDSLTSAAAGLVRACTAHGWAEDPEVRRIRAALIRIGR